MPTQGQQIFKLHKMDDHTAYSTIETLRDFLGISDLPKIRLAHGLDIRPSEIDDIEDLAGHFRVQGIFLYGRASKVNSGLTVTANFQRYHPTEPDNPDATFDYITLNFGADISLWNGRTSDLLQCIEIVTALDVPVAPTDDQNSEMLRSLILSQNASHKSMLSSLNKSIRELAERRAKLEIEVARAEEKRKAEHTAALNEIEAQRAALERQSHMAERRRVARDISKQAADLVRRSSLPTGVRTNALLIFLVATIGAISATTVSFQTVGVLQTHSAVVDMLERLVTDLKTASLSSIPGADNTVQAILDGAPRLTWFLATKIVLSSAIAVVSFGWAAAWLRRYYEEELNYSRSFQRFNADVARATWVVEAIHEIKHEEKGELPPQWIEAVTRNLFNGDSGVSKVDDASLALRALMGLAGSAKVNSSGLEVEIGRKGVKEMGKAE